MSQFSLYSDVLVLSIRLYLQPRRTLMSLFGCIRFLASFRLSFLCIYSSHSPYVFRGMQLFTILCSIIYLSFRASSLNGTCKNKSVYFFFIESLTVLASLLSLFARLHFSLVYARRCIRLLAKREYFLYTSINPSTASL
jgi:hypothetical protein